MKKALLLCLLHILLIGCSSSGPDIVSVSSSDQTPFTGQTLLLSVYSLTDNPPMNYTWECSAGTFDEWEDSDYWIYWTAPEETGAQSVTCTVRDDADDIEMFTFTMSVQERSIDDTLVDDPVLSLCKHKESRIGGIWASTEQGDIRYITSGTNEVTTWEGAFTSMHIELSSTSTYTLWGAESTGTDIFMHSQSSGAETLSCETCDETDTINDLTVDVIDDDLLWVGSDSGIHYYTLSSEEWGDEAYQSGKTHDFFQGESFVYVATTNGIYEMNPYTEIATGDSCAVLEVVNDDDTVTVWHITDSSIYRNGQLMDPQPGAVVCSLDKGWDNTVWCGKYWWDAAEGQWQSPEGLDAIDITESVVSNEGLVYLVTTSGTLLRW